ncbi:MAG: hypothetical protein ACYCQJ_15050 [Nitrososphaerales archaeon]
MVYYLLDSLGERVGMRYTDADFGHVYCDDNISGGGLNASTETTYGAGNSNTQRGIDVQDYVLGITDAYPRLDHNTSFYRRLLEEQGTERRAVKHFHNMLDEARRWITMTGAWANTENNGHHSRPDAYIGDRYISVEIKNITGRLSSEDYLQIARHCRGSRSNTCFVLIISPARVTIELFVLVRG